jgi:hypothetical protein
MTFDDIIPRLDDAIRKARPKFHRQLKPPATEEDKARVEACLGRPLPGPALAWFGWCGGSEDGLVPATAWGGIEIDELIDHHPFTTDIAASMAVAPEVMLPLLTDRAGDVWYYLEAPNLDGPSMVLAERGDIASAPVAFDAWLQQELLDAWLAEACTVHVDWVRAMRTPMGWTDLQLPKRAATQLAKRLATGGPVQIRNGVPVEPAPPEVLIKVGASPAWERHEGHTVVTLTAEGLEQLAKALKARETSIFIEELGDLKISFEDR